MLKSFFHKSFQALGFDVVSIRNFEKELEKRERARQQDSLNQFRRLRELPRKANADLPRDTIWVSRTEMLSAAVERMLPADVVLDIGCAFRPQQFIEARIHICCEPFREYMDRLQLETAGASKYVYLSTDLLGATNLFPDKSVDTIFMVDVIEHIDREIGRTGLQRLKRIARSQVIIFTPLGYMDQDPIENGVDQWGMGGVEWQKHRSGWYPEDFRAEEGWTVIASKDFHEVDGYSRQVDQPVGAFWAICNCL
jgi:hypothetical protein